MMVPILLAALACAEEKHDAEKAPDAPAETATQPAEAGEPEPYSDPATRPAEPRVLARVGDKEITSESIDRIMAMYAGRIPPAQLEAAKESMIQQMILQELRGRYLATIEVNEKDIQAEKDALLEQIMQIQGITEEDLKNQARQKKLQNTAVSDEAVAELIKTAPASWLDGTMVEARHILTQAPVYASEQDAAAARAKLEKVAKQIEDKKLSFGEAAKTFSEGPSAGKGGDLGEFTFDQMVLPFSKAAFALKAGETSKIVRSPFGYHLIQVTKVTPGEGVSDEQKKEIAKRILMGELQDKILSEALKIAPVEIVKERPAAPGTAPATQGASDTPADQ